MDLLTKFFIYTFAMLVDNDELYFRDYLNEHAQTAKEYETIKLRLWKLFEHNRDAYTNAKTGFIKKWTQEAKKVYTGRY